MPSRLHAHSAIHLNDSATGDRNKRVDQLLDAVLVIGSGLELQDVLRRIVEVAVTLVDARYGALGVVDESGDGLAQFVTVGMDEAQIDRIGPLPTGRGMLGQVIRDPRPIRLVDLTKHPASSGFPPGHPSMRSFLGVPVRVEATVFGNLYLTEKSHGLPFDDEDESIVGALALAAGVAIQRARLYDESRRRGAWVEASEEISTALLSGLEREGVMALVVSRARSVLTADLTFTVYAEAGGLHVQASDGPAAAELLVAIEEPLNKVMAEGLPQQVLLEGRWGTAVPLGPHDRPGNRALVAMWSRRPDPTALEDLTAFAAQAAVALELAERRAEAELVAIVQDRDRIGRDLHDLVIQRLFATGMQLQSAIRLVGADPLEAQNRINRAVNELDETIRELRSTIYGLQAPVSEQPSLRAQLLEVVDAGATQLGFTPALQLEGLLDTMATPEAGEHALATLREALSNAARHAAAQHVEVRVAVLGNLLQVRVEDDGRGMAQDGERRGLRNLAVRAERLGGTLRVTSVPGAGTTLLWQVPI